MAAAGPATTDTPAAGVDPWTVNATAHRGQNGATYSLACPPGGTAHIVWGTETYTDDSSVCTAAVHVGLITLASGGTVQYRIAAGLSSYAGTVGHGVTTESYGVWNGSFIFPAAPPGSGHFAVGPDSWSTNATTHRGQNGTKVTVPCSPNGTLGSVYGTGTYTDDSSVCTAAVQAGLITVAQGGTVVIQIAAGQSSYTGSTANGVTSSSYGSWGGSYTFPKDQTPA